LSLAHNYLHIEMLHSYIVQDVSYMGFTTLFTIIRIIFGQILF